MTIKQVKKNVSAENFMNLDNLIEETDAYGNLVLTFTRKNFKTDEVGNSYVLTDDFYTKTEIDEKVRIHIVRTDDEGNLFEEESDLPVPGKFNYIYLIPFRGANEETDTGEGIFREYIWTDLPDGSYTYPNDDSGHKYGYESIGSTKIDIHDMQVISNLVTAWSDTQGESTSDSKYPSEKLVKDTFDLLDDVAWSGDYEDLSNTPYIPEKTSDLENDGDGTVQNDKYLMFKDITTYLKQSDVVDNLISNSTIYPLSAKQGKALSTAISNHIDDSNAHSSLFNLKANQADLKTVAFTGNYNDLTNKPPIPTQTSDLTNNGDGVNGAFVTANQLSNNSYTKAEINDMSDKYVVTITKNTLYNNSNSRIKNYTEEEKTYENLLAAYDGNIEGALIDYIKSVNHAANPCILSVRDVGVFYYLPDRVNNGDGSIIVIQPDLITAIPIDVSDLNNDSAYVTETLLGSILASYITKSQVVDNVSTSTANVPLSANQGKYLYERITAIEGAGYITAANAANLYLPTAGGALTGPVTHPSAKQNTTDNLVYAGTIQSSDSVIDVLRDSKSLLATLELEPNQGSWVNAISVRQNNGSNKYGLYLYSPFATTGDLKWGQDINGTNTEKTILDSTNYTNYANMVQVIDALNSESTSAALSAAQGKSLNDNKFGTVTSNGGLTAVSGTEIDHKAMAPNGTAENTRKIRKFSYDKYGHISASEDATVVEAVEANGALEIVNNTTLKHKKQSSISTSDSNANLKKVAYDDYGHITGVNTVAASDIPGHNSNISTSDSNASLKKISYDTYGHITGINTVSASDIPGLSSKFDTASDRLTASGTTVKHSKETINTSDSNATLKKIKYDDYGHITGVADVTSDDLGTYTQIDTQTISGVTFTAKVNTLLRMVQITARGKCTAANTTGLVYSSGNLDNYLPEAYVHVMCHSGGVFLSAFQVGNGLQVEVNITGFANISTLEDKTLSGVLLYHY